MHTDEVEISLPLVQKLLQKQFPRWAARPLTPVPSAGTDNALFRLGKDMVVRLPRIHWASENIAKEFRWLPRLAPILPLLIPTPLALGEPGEGYPWSWAIYQWLEGKDATTATPKDPFHAAEVLAKFILTLQDFTHTDKAPLGRGLLLAERNQATRTALLALKGSLNTSTALAIWEFSLKTPAWEPSPVWIHGDLIAPNLLIKQGRLHAILDFGTLGVGDPACDLVAAWSFLRAETRNVFRQALGVDEATWLRGRGWAFSQALIILPYYQITNPGLFTVAKRIIREVMADFS